jgi:hypothetical protein
MAENTGWSTVGSRARSGAARIGEALGDVGKAAGQFLSGEGGEGGNIVDVTMLGSTGTGKTSLLASIYDQIDMVIGETDLAIVADERTSLRLQEAVDALSSLPGEIKLEGGLPGTSEIRDYGFGVGRRGNPPLFKLRFTDYPGKYLMNPGTSEGERLQRALLRADVILVAIDTPALMERHGTYHELVNRPRIVMDQLRRILIEPKPRLIILVPLKCERQISTPEGARKLTQEVTSRYAGLLNYINAGDLRERVGCVLAPAQTLGSVFFSRIDEGDGKNPLFVYRSLSRDAPYRPVDTDQPLRYALRFIVNKYRKDDRGIFRTMVQKAYKTDAALVTAVDQFAAGCKSNDSYRVLQSHGYLQRRR